MIMMCVFIIGCGFVVDLYMRFLVIFLYVVVDWVYDWDVVWFEVFVVYW